MAFDAPLQYLHTAGPAVDPVTRLQWGLIAVSAAVFVLVSAALVLGLARRRPQGAGRELAVPADHGGLAWIYVGAALTVVVLAGCAAWTVLVLRATTMPAAAPQLTIEVTAAQWWWRARYRDRGAVLDRGDRGDPGAGEPPAVFTVANELHVPVGRPVRVQLASEDVIHSFWIPQLAGKIDTIPGRTNELWLQADEVGTYRGQCAEFCGAQHAQMAMVVVAEEPAAYAAWRAHQIDPAAAAPAGLAAGEAVFGAHCGACHTVRGTAAGGVLGPDLTHLMSRRTIAAGTLPNTPQNLAAWVADPQVLKPGTRMPSPRLTPQDLRDVLAWLGSLR